MTESFDPSNDIDPTARIACDVRMGRFNRIGPGVTIEPFKEGEAGPVSIGDCNRLEAGVRLLVGPGGLAIGDWNTIHNHTTVSGVGTFRMGHNCWIGQECYLDATGGLDIGNGVTLGVRTVIWTHIGRGERVEGWLCRFRPVTLEDDVWLVGDGIHVSPGVRMGKGSAALSRSVVTKDVGPGLVCAGSPAAETDVQLRKPIALAQKMALMRQWAERFCQARGGEVTDIQEGSGFVTRFVLERNGESLAVWMGFPQDGKLEAGVTHFDLAAKVYTKRLSALERDFVRFLADHKARFVPRVEADG